MWYFTNSECQQAHMIYIIHNQIVNWIEQYIPNFKRLGSFAVQYLAVEVWGPLLTYILQGCLTGIGAIIWLPQCQWNNLEWYG